MSCITPRITTLILVSGILTFQAANAADDMTINRLVASQCAQCHGTNGHSVAGIDSLAGKKELMKKLLEMQSKPNDIMEHQASGYTEDQLRRIGAYYASIPKDGGSDSDEEDKEDKEDEEDKHKEDKHKEDKHREDKRRTRSRDSD